MKMNPWTLSVLLLLAGPLGADPDWHVEYPDSFCVVEGSTATIPCSFTHPSVMHKVERVVWCRNREYCIPPVFFGYDSSNVRANSRFLYPGDLVGNCTLKIIKTVKKDAATYRFRFETNGDKYTGPRGVRVKVTDGEDVKVRSSVTDNVVKEGGQVTLTCTSACSFHQLDVHWYRNGHALSEKGPALHLSSLTNDDTGNYTCSLDSSRQKTSAPWSLIVVVDEGRYARRVAVPVVSVVLAVFLLLLAGLVFAKRHAQKKASEVIQKQEVNCKQEAVGASEEVSYSTVHFKRNSSRSAPGPEHEIVYSEVVH
ncbi:unnamed protein product [Gadus morhua 'NCC']